MSLSAGRYSSRAPAFRGNLAKSDLFRQRGSLRRIVGRDHGIVGRQVPFLAVLRRRQAEPGQMTPQRLKSFAVVQTDQEVGGDRPSDRHRGRLRLDLGRLSLRPSCEPLNS